MVSPVVSFWYLTPIALALFESRILIKIDLHINLRLVAILEFKGPVSYFSYDFSCICIRHNFEVDTRICIWLYKSCVWADMFAQLFVVFDGSKANLLRAIWVRYIVSQLPSGLEPRFQTWCITLVWDCNRPVCSMLIFKKQNICLFFVAAAWLLRDILNYIRWIGFPNSLIIYLKETARYKFPNSWNALTNYHNSS